MAPLDLRQRTDGQITTLSPYGELDLSSAPQLEAAVERLCTDPAHEVILDLSGLTFVDTAGVSTLLSCRQLFEESDCGFWVMSPRRSVRRILQRYGLVESKLFGDG